MLSTQLARCCRSRASSASPMPRPAPRAARLARTVLGARLHRPGLAELRLRHPARRPAPAPRRRPQSRPGRLPGRPGRTPTGLASQRGGPERGGRSGGGGGEERGDRGRGGPDDSDSDSEAGSPRPRPGGPSHWGPSPGVTRSISYRHRWGAACSVLSVYLSGYLLGGARGYPSPVVFSFRPPPVSGWLRDLSISCSISPAPVGFWVLVR